jgi:hypothetical protein
MNTAPLTTWIASSRPSRRSTPTRWLFAQVAEPGSCLHEALARYFSGVPDAATPSLLGAG